MTEQTFTIEQIEKAASLVNYDPETGVFRWAVSRCGCHAGDLAGDSRDGYWRIRIKRKAWRAHRLAWFITYGEVPNRGIDHINRNRSDNRMVNLRLASSQENSRNLPLSKANKTGITGVFWNRSKGKWEAKIKVHYKDVLLGRFNNLFEACCARRSAEIKYNFHPNHGKALASLPEEYRGLV